MDWLVAGLGNPGERYANTRHNAGRMAVEELASDAGERLRKARFTPATTATVRLGDALVLLACSTRFMNESGPSYAGLAAKHDIPADRVIAVHDELDLAAGTIRVKAGGGSGGHNGLRSLDSALGTREFLRVRVGIGRPPGRQDPADFVLRQMGSQDAADLAITVGTAAEAVRALITEGLTAAQDRYNTRSTGGGA
jgi:PTH1 family peptidyl-tRNA hydrolase